MTLIVTAIIMLDPLTAISLSGAIIQFVEFGTKVISGSHQIYCSGKGALQEHLEIENITKEVNRLNAKILSSRTDPPILHPNTLSQDDASLRELAESCKLVADELLDMLQQLKTRSSSDRSRKWSSFRMAVASQTPWNKDKVPSLEKRLHRVQEQIIRRLMFMMWYVHML